MLTSSLTAAAMRIRLIPLFFLLGCCLPGLAWAAASQTIRIEWQYTPPASPAVTGFKLYQEGHEGAVCQVGVEDPAHPPTTADCNVSLTQDTTNFTLTATFDDGTESPHSAPYLFSAENSRSDSSPFSVPDDNSLDMHSPPEEQGTGGPRSELPSPSVPDESLLGMQSPPEVQRTDEQETGNKLFTFKWTAPAYATRLIKGYRIYLNNGLLCETSDPSVTEISCRADLLREIMTFRMTKVAINGSESNLSNTLVFDPTAYIKSLTFSWEYAQKTRIKGFRIYQNSTLICETEDPAARRLTCAADLMIIPASYTLTAINAGGAETNFSNTLTYTGNAALTAAVTSDQQDSGDGSMAATSTDSQTTAGSNPGPGTASGPAAGASAPLQAVISSSAAAGPAPLTVSFDGSGSTAANATITSYAWSFGDGASGYGAAVSYRYTSAGAYNATLTVTDGKGQTNRVSTPIIVTAPATDNTEAAAGIAADTGLPAEPATGVKIETGEIAVSSEWARVPLTTSFINPIVVAGPPSFNNAKPCTVRIRNVNKTGFDIKITEWDYLDGKHPSETVSYLVMENGRHTLPDGAAVEAGSFTGAASFKTMAFTSAFATVPVVLSTVVSMNDAKTVNGRIKSITTSRFMYQYQEQEKNTNRHRDETVHYIAWEPGNGMIGTLQYAVAKTASAVTNAWYNEKYKSALSQPPLLLAGMQTANDSHPAALRVQNQTAAGFQVKAEAEMSKNNRTKHSAETVGYITLDQPR